MTNKQRVFLITTAIIALVIVALLFRQCKGRQAEQITVTSDTTTTVTPGVVVTPPIFEPEPDFLGVDSLNDLLRHFKGRYSVYKEKATKYEKAIQELTEAVASAGTCEEAKTILEVQVAALALAKDECNVALASLQSDAEKAATPNTYVGEETTAAYRLAWRINTVGTVPDGGFSYTVDAFGRTIETTKTVTEYRARRNSLSALIGLQTQSGRIDTELKGMQRVYGLQYGRNGRRLGLNAQAGYLPDSRNWQASGGLIVHFD